MAQNLFLVGSLVPTHLCTLYTSSYLPSKKTKERRSASSTVPYCSAEWGVAPLSVVLVGCLFYVVL